MSHMNCAPREKEDNVKRARVPILLPNGRPLPCRKTLPSSFLKRCIQHSALSVPGIYDSVVKDVDSLYQKRKQGSRKESTKESFKLHNYGHDKEKLTSSCHNANSAPFNKAENHSPIHRLQTAFDQTRPERQQQGKGYAVVGQPLPPAPFLPTVTVKRRAQFKIKTLSVTHMKEHFYYQPGGFISESKKKRSNINSEQTRSTRRRCMRVTDDEKLFLEATAAMSVPQPPTTR